MAASINDLLTRITDNAGGRSVVATLVSPGKTIGVGGSITISDATNWTTTTAVHFSIYNVLSSGYKDPTSQTDWKGVLSGTTISGLVLKGGTDRNYTAGAIVELTPTNGYAKDLYDWGNTFADTLGNLKTASVQSALNLSNVAQNGWNPVGQTPAYSANNGNKEFVINVPADVTAVLSVGMKVKMDRSTTPPTQAMSFTAASSQYATKASPTGITFTSAFTCEAWVYLNSYTTGAIIARQDNAGTTGGFAMFITSAGQIQIQYGTTTTFTQLLSYQSLPLKRWVHIAGVITSTASKTGAIYINGVLVPNSAPTSAATALTQAAVDLRIGAFSATPASTYFDGYISEARVWSVAQTQANIQANMAISLTGSETNLVALFQGNGNFNDKTANANNLTATGGAIATQTFSTIAGGTTTQPTAAPMNTTEFGLITKVAPFAGGVTPLTIFTGTDYTIPNGTLTNFYYSTQRAPFGFPNGRDKWLVDYLLRARGSVAGNSGTWYNLQGAQLSIPVGSWGVEYWATTIWGVGVAAGFMNILATLSTSNTGETTGELSASGNTSSQSVTEVDIVNAKSGLLNLTAQTIYYLNAQPSAGGSGTLYLGTVSVFGTPTTWIRAYSTYL